MTDYIKNILQLKTPIFISQTLSLKIMTDGRRRSSLGRSRLNWIGAHIAALRIPSLRMAILTKPLSTSQLTKVVPLCCGSVSNA